MKLRTLLFLFGFLIAPVVCQAETQQPPMDMADPAIAENFRQIYLLADVLSGRRSILQTATASTAVSTNTTGTTFVDTNLSMSFTPRSESSDIVILVFQKVGGVLTVAANAVEVDVQVLRDSTIIEGPKSLCYFAAIANGAEMDFEGSIVAVDSPGSRTTVTYKTQFARGNDSNAITHRCQGHGATSYMLAFEISPARTN